MDQIVLMVLTLALVALVGYSLWCNRANKEQFEKYDEKTAISLAQKNETNIEDLKKKLQNVKGLSDQLQAIQKQCDTNTNTITEIVKSCKK